MNRSRLIFFVAVVFLIVVILTGAFLLVLNQLKTKNTILTPTTTGTIVSPTFTPVPIKTGPVAIDGNVSSNQQLLAEQGAQVFRFDPMQVAREDGKAFGFSADDNFQLLTNSFDTNVGTWLADVRVFHGGSNYQIRLKQPNAQGIDGIWNIYEIRKE